MAEEIEDDGVAGDASVQANDEAFESSLRGFLDSPKGQKLKLRSRRIRKFLDAPPSKRRTRFLRRFKNQAAAHLHSEGMSSTADANAIDWANIDWDKIFEFLTKIFELIMKLAPLFI